MANIYTTAFSILCFCLIIQKALPMSWGLVFQESSYKLLVLLLLEIRGIYFQM